MRSRLHVSSILQRHNTAPPANRRRSNRDKALPKRMVPNVNIKDILGPLGRIRFRGGIFGKMTVLLIVLILSVSAVAFKLAGWLALLLLLPVMALVWYALKRLFDFANSFPAVAVLDGRELIDYAKVVEARKGVPIILPTTPVPDHAPPPMITSEIDAPDTPETRALAGPNTERHNG